MAGTVQYKAATAQNTRGPSPILWADCPVDEILRNPSKGQHMFDDFKAGVVADATLVLGQRNGLTAYAESDAAADVALQADDDGVILIQSDGTDNDVYCVVDGDNTSGQWKTPAAGNAKGFWFEARVKVTTVTNGDIGVFIGLAQPGEAKDAGGCFGGDTTAGLADVDYVGFAVLEGDGDDLTIAYNEATSGTAQSSTGKIALVADTWVRVGFKVQPKGYGAEVRFFKDGVDLGDAVAVDISKANANWPGATDMILTIAVASGSGVADGDGLKVDWVRIAQEY